MMDAEALYHDVPPERRERLFASLATHAHHVVTVNGAAWRYIASGQDKEALLFQPGVLLKTDMWSN